MRHITRKWVNQPSTHQPYHKLHGLRVLYDADEERIYFLSGDKISQQIQPIALSDGWPKTSKSESTSKAEDVLKALHETGEPDQDYDHEFYSAVCKKLKKAGFGDCSHREFDKYQGVYISIPGFGKLWTKDVYYSGVKKKEAGSGSTFSYEKGTETEHVLLWPEGEEEDFEIEVTRKDGKVDVSQLTSYLRSKIKKGKK